MNEQHLALCSSVDWAEAVQRWIVPWVLDGIDIGDDVLEVGPGPGLTTDVLRAQIPTVSAVEVDPGLASRSDGSPRGHDVTVVHADATATGLPADRFTGAVCLTMLQRRETAS